MRLQGNEIEIQNNKLCFKITLRFQTDAYYTGRNFLNVEKQSDFKIIKSHR